MTFFVRSSIGSDEIQSYLVTLFGNALRNMAMPFRTWFWMAMKCGTCILNQKVHWHTEPLPLLTLIYAIFWWACASLTANTKHAGGEKMYISVRSRYQQKSIKNTQERTNERDHCVQAHQFGRNRNSNWINWN